MSRGCHSYVAARDEYVGGVYLEKAWLQRGVPGGEYEWIV